VRKLLVSLIAITSFAVSFGETIDQLSEKNGIFFSKETNKKFTGNIETYFENGQLRTEGKYVDGKQHGIQKSYFDTGALASEANYVNGKVNGVRKSYLKDGTLLTEAKYVNNELKEIKKYDKNGNLIEKKEM